MPLNGFQVVLGLEVHAQLLTQSKLFSAASSMFGAEPNVHTQPVCVAFPGTLPVLNERVVELAIRAGLALECRINHRSEWSRKHYFYPDLPKGYQITQFEFPICEWGKLTAGGKEIRIRRIHIEEDAGKLVHEGSRSLVDLNRAGNPLVEIVSEPDLRSGEEAVEYLKALREVLVAIGVNDGNLEEGSFRCDANVSVMKRGSTELGTRCELKNLNSFRFIKQAIEYETQRQVDLIESGGTVVQETRLFDSHRGETRSMRSKEDAHDYRYFPEPDLPVLVVTQSQIDEVRRHLPELPRARRTRFVEVMKLPPYDAEVLTADLALADLFEECVEAGVEPKKASNWFMGELSKLLNESKIAVREVKFTASQFAALIASVEAGSISANAAKEVFADMFATGRDASLVIAEKGLGQVNDTGEVERLVDEAIAANPGNAESYRAGKTALIGFFVGAVMKAMKGRGNPKLINELLVKKLRP